MKRLLYIIIGVIVLMLVSISCENKSITSKLDILDTLMRVSPDSVYAILDSMDTQQMSKSQRMRHALLLADAQNKAYIDFTTDSVMLTVAAYYDEHGTPNEQMRAHYLLGCTYRDMNDVPMELQCFLEAVEKADTTAKDCDFYTLVAIYGQMANIYHSQYLPEEELKALEDCEKVAILNGDTIYAIMAYALKSRPYYLKNQRDSVLKILENARDKYIAVGETKEAAGVLALYLDILIDKGEYQDIRKYMEIYETQSGDFDVHGNIAESQIKYYYDKGRFALYENKVDSALFFFSILVNENILEEGYRGLLQTYQQLHQPDSMAKYALLYAEANDSSFIGMNSEKIEQMTAMYNYGRHKRNAEIKTQENIQLKQRLYLSIFIALIVIGLISRWLLHLRQIERDKKDAIANSYFEALLAKDKIEKEIDQLKGFMTERENAMNEQKSQSEQKAMEEICAKNNLLYEKEQELQQLQDYITELKSKYEVVDKIDTVKRLEAFKKTTTYIQIAQSKLFKDNITAKNNLRWKEFCYLYAQYFPIYYTFINCNSELSTDEKKVCLLLVVDFTPIEIARIMNKSRSQISNNRASISKKLYSIDSAKALTEKLLKDFHKDI